MAQVCGSPSFGECQVSHLSDLSFSGSSFSLTAPAQGITLAVTVGPPRRFCSPYRTLSVRKWRSNQQTCRTTRSACHDYITE